MDIKVYKKEEVLQPSGTEFVYVPDVIDLIPVLDGDVITGAVELEDDSKELLEQECALATIWQRGLDPLALNVGIQWSEALLEEVSPLQIMTQLQDAIAETTTRVHLEFDVIEDSNGNSFLTYNLKEVA